jgi:hypothetical protein
VFDGQWHHIAAVYNGAQKVLYVDGQVDAQAPYTATVSRNNVNVRLGYNSEYSAGQYDGRLDDVRIYDRPLSQAEVQALLAPPGDPPGVTIGTPPQGSLFRAGQVVSFSANATDTEDGTLPASAFSWQVLLRQGASTSTVLTLNGVQSGSFTVPVTGLAITGTLQYEIRVTVTDSDGMSNTASRTLDPERVRLTFDTVPSGLMVYRDGLGSATPFGIDSVVGYQHVIEAPDAGAGNQLYRFASWSDGGAQTHTINAPASPTSFIATYTVTALDPSLDQDGDGMLNGFEIAFGLDPLDPSDGSEDLDGDGLTNLDEQGFETDPTLADTDGDTFSDGDEVAAGTDPLDPLSFPEVADPSLVAWYEFNANGGGTVPDSSGNGHNGSCTVGSTCPVFVSGDGQPPGSYDFTGNGNYIQLPNESAFDFTTQFSVTLWMRSSNPPNAWAQLIGKGDSAWGIERQQSTNQVSFTTFAPAAHNMVGATNVFDGQWHHIAAVYNGAQKILYVDGQVNAQAPYTATVSRNNVNVRLGYNSEYPAGQYDGRLDDVRIFSRPLSQAEVTQILNESIP